jgi:hypothetical protein
MCIFALKTDEPGLDNHVKTLAILPEAPNPDTICLFTLAPGRAEEGLGSQVSDLPILPGWMPKWVHARAGTWRKQSPISDENPSQEHDSNVPDTNSLLSSPDPERLARKTARCGIIKTIQPLDTIPPHPTPDMDEDTCYDTLSRTFILIEYLVTYTPRPGQTREDRRVEFIEALYHFFTTKEKHPNEEHQTDLRAADFAAWYEYVITRHPFRGCIEDEQYALKLLDFLSRMQFFITDRGVIGVVDREAVIQEGEEG